MKRSSVLKTIGTKSVEERVASQEPSPSKLLERGWDQMHMRLAQNLAMHSDHPDHKVGAVLVYPEQGVVGRGWNHLPRGSNGTDRRIHRIHAEAMALLDTPREWMFGACLYVTHPPCGVCCALMVEAGVARVVYQTGNVHFMNKWTTEAATGREILKNAGVEIVEVQYGR